MKTTITCILVLLSLCGTAQTSSYTFVREGGQISYLDPADTNVTEHTVADDIVLPAKVALGFSFLFNGTRYDSIGISENGFIWFGPAQAPDLAGIVNPVTATLPAGVNGVVCAFGIDLHPHVAASVPTTIRSKTQWWNGQPSDFIVEWRNTSRQAAIGHVAGEDTIGFQVQLFALEEDRVQITYGYDIALNPALSSQLSVGMKGASNTDFALRSMDSSGSWNTTATAAALQHTCTFSAAKNPGLAMFNYMSWLNKSRTGISEPTANTSLHMYPVPASDRLTVTGGEHAEAFTIWRTDGRMIRTLAGGAPKIDISDLQPGLYILQLKTAQGMITGRFVKN